jgi:hypothetical protein
MLSTMDKQDFILRVELEPENDKPGFMKAFDEIVTGPLDSVHIERMSDDLYWMSLEKDGRRQIVVIGSASGKAKVIGRSEAD